MPNIQLRFTCSSVDAEPLAMAIHEQGDHVVHLREETVFGRDFSDATATERVKGQLKRCSIELLIDEGDAEQMIEFVRNFKRSAPVRWVSMPILDAGRLS